LFSQSEVFRKQTKWDEVIQVRKEASEKNQKESDFLGHPSRDDGGNRLSRSIFPKISQGLLKKYSDLLDLKKRMSSGSTPG
jgi:hypothetical protein